MAETKNRVLVVGGGSGIGFAVAQSVVHEGASVVIASTSKEKLARAGEKLGPAASAAVLDITDEPAVERFFARESSFDHIVTTAGDWSGPRRGPLAEMDLTAAAQLFRVRFWGAAAVAKHGAKTLPPGGSLTLTNGMIAHRPSKGSTIATSMAGAIEHLTRALAVELSPVRVNCVCPGLVRTGVWDSIPEDKREAQLASMTKRQLIPRAGDPQEIAVAYLYLMRAGFTTGQILHVEGGSALGS
jgi:NAD(P)-dependent dehydrogenase (short-subunit alcohol dehydrogenase family)